MTRRTIAALLGALLLLPLGLPAAAAIPEHETDTQELNVRWRCPGEDPRERATMTTRRTTYSRDGRRVKVIAHVQWRGWITHRETGALLRDDATWTETYHYDGRRLLRTVLTGGIWRLVVPGHGIVMHQTGRRVTIEGDDAFETPFFAEPSFDDGLCRYV